MRICFQQKLKDSGEEYGVVKNKGLGGLNCPSYIAEMLPERRLFVCLGSHVSLENFSLI